MKTTVIVPTYNRPQALALCLRSLAQQRSLRPNEVMIADDGSGPETRETIERLAGELKQVFPIKHVWQEDIGFRKPKILNETVRQSSGDYLIFIDGDSMAHWNFVQAHVSAGSVNAVVSGKRVEIGKDLTERLLETGRVINSFDLRLLWDAMAGGDAKTRKVEEAIQLRSRLVRRLLHRDRITDDGVWGCNFSLSRELFYDINGCDEDFVDGSIEDNDIGIRVLNQGKSLRSVRGLAIIFHLWHRTSWSFENEKYQQNLAILKQRMDLKETYCRNGIQKKE